MSEEEKIKIPLTENGVGEEVSSTKPLIRELPFNPLTFEEVYRLFLALLPNYRKAALEALQAEEGSTGGIGGVDGGMPHTGYPKKVVLTKQEERDLYRYEP